MCILLRNGPTDSFQEVLFSPWAENKMVARGRSGVKGYFSFGPFFFLRWYPLKQKVTKRGKWKVCKKEYNFQSRNHSVNERGQDLEAWREEEESQGDKNSFAKSRK